MADTAVTLSNFTGTSGVYQSGLSTAGTAVNTGDTAVIAAVGNTRQIVILLYGNAASTVTFQAGDEPPSESAGLGNASAITVGNGETTVVVLPAGRYVQSDGSVRALVGGTGPVDFTALVVPRSV